MSHNDYWRKYAESLETLIACVIVPSYEASQPLNLGKVLPPPVLTKLHAHKQSKLPALLKPKEA